MIKGSFRQKRNGAGMMILVKISIRQKGKEREIFGRKDVQRDDQKCEREYFIRENETE